MWNCEIDMYRETSKTNLTEIIQSISHASTFKWIRTLDVKKITDESNADGRNAFQRIQHDGS
jgi:hypothetical protein